MFLLGGHVYPMRYPTHDFLHLFHLDIFNLLSAAAVRASVANIKGLQ